MAVRRNERCLTAQEVCGQVTEFHGQKPGASTSSIRKGAWEFARFIGSKVKTGNVSRVVVIDLKCAPQRQRTVRELSSRVVVPVAKDDGLRCVYESLKPWVSCWIASARMLSVLEMTERDAFLESRYSVQACCRRRDFHRVVDVSTLARANGEKFAALREFCFASRICQLRK